MEQLIMDFKGKLMFLDFNQREQVVTELEYLLKDYSVERMTRELSTDISSTFMLINQWCDVRLSEGLKQDTVTNQKRYVVNMFMDCGKSHLTLNSLDITLFIRRKMIAGVGSNTIQNYYKAICNFYKFLMKYKMVTYNPMDDVTKVKKKPVIHEAFSQTDIEKLKDGADLLELTMIEFWISTACRLNETINIKISDIDFLNKEVKVMVAKNDKPRIVYLTDVALMRIKEYLSTRTDNEPWLFVKSRGHTKFTKHGIYSRFRKLGKKCGVDKCHPHRFRRTFCTNGLSKGMPIHEMQKLMGHASINTTIIYDDITNTRLKRSFDTYVN